HKKQASNDQKSAEARHARDATMVPARTIELGAIGRARRAVDRQVWRCHRASARSMRSTLGGGYFAISPLRTCPRPYPLYRFGLDVYIGVARVGDPGIGISTTHTDVDRPTCRKETIGQSLVTLADSRCLYDNQRG